MNPELPKRTEFALVDFFGVEAKAQRALRALQSDLVIKAFDKSLAKLPLEELMALIFDGHPSYRLEVGSKGPCIRESSPKARESLLRGEMQTRFGRTSFTFLYGDDKQVRYGKGVRQFPWGIRVVTKDGHRNFSWEKIHTETVKPPQHWQIAVESNFHSDRRVFAWELCLLNASEKWGNLTYRTGSFSALLP